MLCRRSSREPRSSAIASRAFESAASSPASVEATPPARPMDWFAVGVWVYAVVAVGLLVRLIASLAGAARLRASCSLVEDKEWLESLERCRRRLGIGREVTLARSSRVGVPIILGWFRPIVVLPTAPTSLNPREHADAVLLHELAHARRSDYAWNVLLRIIQAVYWPHPLVWLLGRAIAEFRERACDDLCVYELGGPAAYRETLLAAVAGLSNRSSAAIGLAMAGTSKLSRRLARIEQSRGDARCLPGLPVAWRSAHWSSRLPAFSARSN